MVIWHGLSGIDWLLKNPDLIKVLLKMGDELLDAQVTQAFYDQKRRASIGTSRRRSSY